jgi:hypothetical protein
VDRLFESDEKGSKTVQPPSISTVNELAKENSPFNETEDNKRFVYFYSNLKFLRVIARDSKIFERI